MSLTNKVLYDIDQSNYPSYQKAIARKNIGAYEDKTTDGGIPKADLDQEVQSSLSKADSALQGVKVNGTELSKDSNNEVDVPVPTASTSTPSMDGSASTGSETKWARGDHVHPTDTTRETLANKKQSVDPTSTTDYLSAKGLADFVNSSVATNTANFLGTISESSLGLEYTATNEQISLALNVHSWVSTPTNNDYCFVSVNDPQTTDVDEYRRFKFDGSVWAYEYTLNNSSFTQAQWDAINSGLTYSDRTTYNAAVTRLNTHVGDSSIHVTSSEKNAWNAKQDVVSTDTDSSAFGDNTPIATGFSSNKLNLNIASRLWTYIKGKISSVLGLTASSYDGKAASAGYADSAGSAIDSTKLPLAGGTMTGDVIMQASDGGARQIQFKMADNDYARVCAGGSSNSGWFEIATADDGNEPIYVRQYTGAFTTVVRTLTLLDGSGNTQIPAHLTVRGKIYSNAGLAVKGSGLTVGVNDSSVSGYQQPTELYGTLYAKHTVGANTFSMQFTAQSGQGLYVAAPLGVNGNVTLGANLTHSHVVNGQMTINGNVTVNSGYLNATFLYGKLVAANRIGLTAAYNVNNSYTPTYQGELLYLYNNTTATVSVTYKNRSGNEVTKPLPIDQMCCLMCIGGTGSASGGLWAYR